jgi:hypothetical protein
VTLPQFALSEEAPELYDFYVSLAPFAFLPAASGENKKDWQVLDG